MSFFICWIAVAAAIPWWLHRATFKQRWVALPAAM
jgi:hypothetical protein